jgi:hypothetical protein
MSRPIARLLEPAQPPTGFPGWTTRISGGTRVPAATPRRAAARGRRTRTLAG